MGRSGQLICRNDYLIMNLINDPNYEVRADGTVWTLIGKNGRPTKVWRQAGSSRRGYVTMKYKQRMLQMHRIIYARFNGPLSEDLVVNHKDGNGCNNDPENLELVTQSVNCYHRFREGSGNYPVMGNKVLDWDKVRSIRALSAEHSYTEISALYGISKGHVSQIVNNEIWIEGKNYAVSTAAS